jgi:hypothetical protein
MIEFLTDVRMEIDGKTGPERRTSAHRTQDVVGTDFSLAVV